MFKSIFIKFNKIIKYFPIIWNDRDFDYSYIFILLKFKIEQIRKREEKIKFYKGWESDVKYMKICENLLNKLIKEDHGWSEKTQNYNLNKEIKYLKKCKRLLFLILDNQIWRWWD